MKWAADHGINTTATYQSSKDSPVIEQPNSLSAVTEPEALMILAKKAGTPDLELEFQLGAYIEGFYLITISSNYTFLKDRKSIAQRHIDALDGYLKKHGISQGPPGWYLDYERYKWHRIY